MTVIYYMKGIVEWEQTEAPAHRATSRKSSKHPSARLGGKRKRTEKNRSGTQVPDIENLKRLPRGHGHPQDVRRNVDGQS